RAVEPGALPEWQAFLPAPPGPALSHLVVAAPEHHRRVHRQTRNLMQGLLAHIFHEKIAVGVHAAGKHKVLPYHDAEAVAQLVKSLALIPSPTPHAQAVHVDGS